MQRIISLTTVTQIPHIHNRNQTKFIVPGVSFRLRIEVGHLQPKFCYSTEAPTISDQLLDQGSPRRDHDGRHALHTVLVHQKEYRGWMKTYLPAIRLTRKSWLRDSCDIAVSCEGSEMLASEI
jgi:hypothetical protein